MEGGQAGDGDHGCGLSPERPLHFSEKVLPILHGLGMDSHLVVKKHQSMEAMLLYLGRWRGRAGQADQGTRGVEGRGQFLHPGFMAGVERRGGGLYSPRLLQSSPSQPRR